MSYNKNLFDKISVLLKSIQGVEPKKMFGGICFMHRGNMLCGIDGDRLMVRVGPEQYEYALSLKYASVMDITGKPMKGFIFVNPTGTKSKTALKKWIELGLNFTSTLSPKNKKASRKKGPAPLKNVKNFGPVTLAEFESMRLTTLEQLKSLGVEGTCRKWVQYYPERLNANAFLGVICAIEDTVWTEATPEQRNEAHAMVKALRREFGLPQVKRKQKKHYQSTR